MALILLILIGASAGWVASIITRTEAAGAVLRQMGVGLAGSLVAGLISNSATILGGLNLLALGASILGAAIALGAYHLYLRRTADA